MTGKPGDSSPIVTRLVAPGEVVDQVATVLQRAWPAPVIHYSLDYCGWQFRFPGAQPTLMAATFDGDRVVGVMAAVPRRMALGARVENVCLLSFLGVDPDYRRRGIARELYRVLLPEISRRELVMMVFAKTNTAGLGLIESEPTALGFHGVSLGDYVIHGFMARGGDAPMKVEVCQDVSSLQFADAGPTMLASRPDLLQLQHYAVGEHQRIAVVRNEAGAVAGAAVVNHSRYVNQRGLEWTTIVDSFLIAPTSADALKSLLTYAATEFAEDGAPALCTVPNVSGLDPEWFRPVGLRRTATSYSGIVYSMDAEHPMLAARRTNLEIA